ncbi:LPXTG cell wall anchor domain-containing protein [Cellulosimicrobium cellulans]|uniref:LPXTG cell wall anchor domain-containing protein n=1 Tax=Cellulosimicrobium cellulans TaxID=1710 RepID=UPI0036E9F782
MRARARTACAAGTAGPPDDGAGVPPASDSPLPATGADAARPLAAAGLLLLAGGGLLVVRRVRCS